MKRIKKFSLGNHDYTIRYLKQIYDGDGKAIFGRANPMTNTVEIALMVDNQKLSEDVIAHTIHHELSHLIMVLMNEWELNGNEVFIDNLGGLIAQFNKTKR